MILVILYWCLKKYEIASGYMGAQYFVIGNMKDVHLPDEVTLIGEEIYSRIGTFVESNSGKMTLDFEGYLMTF